MRAAHSARRDSHIRHSLLCAVSARAVSSTTPQSRAAAAQASRVDSHDAALRVSVLAVLHMASQRSLALAAPHTASLYAVVARAQQPHSSSWCICHATLVSAGRSQTTSSVTLLW